MVDYSVDEDFDIHRNEWNDFVTVDGLQEFEQNVVILLHYHLRDVVSSYQSSKTAKEKIKLGINRVAEKYNVIDSIDRIHITKSLNAQYSYEVEIEYNIGNTFSEEI